jgi:hypothetical protein
MGSESPQELHVCGTGDQSGPSNSFPACKDHAYQVLIRCGLLIATRLRINCSFEPPKARLDLNLLCAVYTEEETER